MKTLIFIVLISLSSASSHSQTLELFELQKRCSVESSKFLEQNKVELLSPSKDALNTFSNHFNKKNGWCLFSINTIIPTRKYVKFIDIYNVLENKSVVSFMSGTHAKTGEYMIFMCKLSNGNKCNTELEVQEEAIKLMSE